MTDQERKRFNDEVAAVGSEVETLITKLDALAAKSDISVAKDVIVFGTMLSIFVFVLIFGF
jgi:hypothetical protein